MRTQEFSGGIRVAANGDGKPAAVQPVQPVDLLVAERAGFRLELDERAQAAACEALRVGKAFRHSSTFRLDRLHGACPHTIERGDHPNARRDDPQPTDKGRLNLLLAAIRQRNSRQIVMKWILGPHRALRRPERGGTKRSVGKHPQRVPVRIKKRLAFVASILVHLALTDDDFHDFRVIAL